jgi:(S)-mandelate dehydrogenase
MAAIFPDTVKIAMTTSEMRNTASPPSQEAAVGATAPAAASSLRRAWSIEDLRRLAQRRLPRAVFDFYDGGAEDETTLRDNRAAFQRTRIIPRTLLDVSRIDTATRLLGERAALPIAVAPTGAPGFGWPKADVCIARAAAAFGIPYTLSTMASASIERIRREAGGRLWFQAYVFKQRELTLKLIDRARDFDYEALMITVDVPVGGKRERDFVNDFAVPFRYTRRNFLDFATHPGWVYSILRHGMPVLENVASFTPEASNASQIASSIGRYWDPAFNWDSLKEIRDRWPRKLLVKGVLRAEDAERLAAMGCDAIVVSNHGGRQLDGAIATLDALPGVVRGAGGRAEVWLDGGVRRGADVVKALALGAQGVLVARATLYGVCAAGEAGAFRALEILKDELVRSMQLSGARNIAEIDAGLIAR